MNRIILVFLLLLMAPVIQAGESQTHRLVLTDAVPRTTIEGSVAGYDSPGYVIVAAAGQVLTVTLAAKNPSTYFNVFAPGKQPGIDAALFIGATEGQQFSVLLSESGDYTIEVYLMRNAARRAETASFVLSVALAEP